MKIARSKSHFSACSFIDFDELLLLSYCHLYVLQITLTVAWSLALAR